MKKATAKKKATVKKAGLNPRQKKFAMLHHRYGNATRAYGEAYDAPKVAGVYPNWVSVDGHRLLRNDKVRAELDRLKGEAASLATFDCANVVDYLVLAITTPIGEIGPDSPLCEEYTVADDGKVKTKSVSKIAAIRELARLTGMDAPTEITIGLDEAVRAMLRELMGS